MNKKKIQNLSFFTCILTSFFVRIYYNDLKKKNKEEEIELQKKIEKEKKISFEDLNNHVIEYLEEK